MFFQQGALGSPLYRRYWLGSLASVGATQLLFMGQGWLVFELSGSPLYLGLLGAAGAVPQILVMLFGSVLADRLNKRRMLMTTSSIIAGLLALLAILDASGVVRVWHVIAIAALIGFTAGFDWPTRQAFYPSLIERRHMMSAVALNSVLWQGTRMVVPAVGGMVIALWDTSVIFVAACVGFAIMFFVLGTLPAGDAPASRGSSLSSFHEGFKFVLSVRLFAVLIPLTWTMTFFGTSYIQLMPAFAELLQVGEKGFGFLVSASGVGSVTGTLVIMPFQRARHLGRLMLGGIFLFATALFGFSLVTGLATHHPGAFYMAMLFVFLVSLFGSIFLVSSMTVLQLRVPDDLRGRVMGLHAVTFSLIPLGALFGGAVASASTPPIAVAVGASVVLSAVMGVALTQSEVRNLRGEHAGGQSDSHDVPAYSHGGR